MTEQELIERLREQLVMSMFATKEALYQEQERQRSQAADMIEDLRAQLDKAREECARRAALVSLAYGEGVLDVRSRGATIDNAGELYETSDAKACLDDPECHRSEFPDNYDDALNSARYAMSAQEGE